MLKESDLEQQLALLIEEPEALQSDPATKRKEEYVHFAHNLINR